MRTLSQDDFSIFLDTLLRTVLESQYGESCWTHLEGANLPEAVWHVLNDQDLWRDISGRVTLAGSTFDEVQQQDYLQKVARLFVERVVYRFRIPMLRITPQPWDEERTARWRQEHAILAILTGPETLSIVETVKAIGEGRVGIPISGSRVIGVPEPQWTNGKGPASGGVVIGDDGNPCLVSFEQPLRIDTALILNLSRKNEIDLHRRVTREARAEGVKVLNPASSATDAADRKHIAHERWRSAGVDTPIWRFLPAGWPLDDIRKALQSIAEEVEQGMANGAGHTSVYVLPDDSTEGDRTRRFILTPENLEKTSEFITETIHPTGDALVRRECGNIRFMLGGAPKQAVLRLNVNRDFGDSWFYSGCWQVAGDLQGDVASVGCGGVLIGLEEPMDSLAAVVDGDWVTVPREFWNVPELTERARRAVLALEQEDSARDRVAFIGLDLIPSWYPGDRSLRWTVLEANARPAGLGAAELIS
ncbi:MAG: hypothetical protein ABIH23_30760 [bacterium]